MLLSNINLHSEQSNTGKTDNSEFSQKKEIPLTSPSDKVTLKSPATLFDHAPEVVAGNNHPASVYEKITSAKEDKSIITKLQKNPVSDLKKSIGINEKFSFINELFDGDLNAYNEAIDKLNTSNDHASALEFIETDLLQKYEWKDDGEALLKLKALVGRRFTS